HAVDAYALLDPSMPGATPTDLPPGDGLDATHTLALIEQFRDQLAPEQLEVVPEPSAEDVVGAVEPDGAITEGPPPEGEPPRGLRAPAPGLLRQPSETVQARYLRLLGQVGNDWNAYKPGLLPTQRYELALSRSPIPG